MELTSYGYGYGYKHEETNTITNMKKHGYNHMILIDERDFL